MGIKTDQETAIYNNIKLDVNIYHRAYDTLKRCVTGKLPLFCGNREKVITIYGQIYGNISSYGEMWLEVPESHRYYLFSS